MCVAEATFIRLSFQSWDACGAHVRDAFVAYGVSERETDLCDAIENLEDFDLRPYSYSVILSAVEHRVHSLKLWQTVRGTDGAQFIKDSKYTFFTSLYVE